MTQVRQLFDLQELDVATTVRQSEIQKLEGQLKETEELLGARKSLEEKTSSLQETQKAQHDLETEAEDLRAKLKPLNQKLTGGSVKNPKELVNLQADYNQQKAALTQKDDRLLEMMEEIERARGEVERMKGEVQRLEAAFEDTRVKSLHQLEVEKGVLSDLGQKRQSLAGKLDPASVKLYNSLKARKGKALARVERGMCMGCRVTLPMTLIQRARASSSEAVFCCNCERILLVG